MAREDSVERKDGILRKPPAPTVEKPTLEELQEWTDDGGCEATDGCWVEPDDICEHGHPSWLLHLGMI